MIQKTNFSTYKKLLFLSCGFEKSFWWKLELFWSIFVLIVQTPLRLLQWILSHGWLCNILFTLRGLKWIIILTIALSYEMRILVCKDIFQINSLNFWIYTGMSVIPQEGRGGWVRKEYAATYHLQERREFCFLCCGLSRSVVYDPHGL